MVTRREIERIARSKNRGLPITSLYLNVNGSIGSARNHEILLKGLIKEKKERGYFKRLTPDARSSVEADFNKIESYMKDEYNPKGTKSVVLFSSEGLDLWEAFELGVPTIDTLMINPKPYVKPLSALLSKHRCFGVILVDRAKAKIIRVRLGRQEELFSKVDDNVPGMTVEPGFMGTEERRSERRIEASVSRHFKEVADKAFEFHRQDNFTWLTVGGRRDVVKEFIKSLHPYLAERLAGELHLEPDAALETVFDKLVEIETDARKKIEADLIERLTAALGTGSRGAQGVLECIGALAQGKVDTLIVECGYRQKGFSCSRCDWIGVKEVPVCPLCGAEKPEKTSDIIEDIVLQTFKTGGVVEFVGGTDITRFGHIGALLRY